MKELCLIEGSTIRTSAPSRLEACKAVVAMLVFAGGVFFALPGWISVAASFLFLCLALLFLSSLVFPAKFRQGVQVVDCGFEVWRPLRKPLTLRYKEINEVVAVCRGAGENNDELIFLVKTASASASVLDHDIYVTGVLDSLASLPGFNPDEFDCASNHRATFRDLVFGKRFSIYVAGSRAAAWSLEPTSVGKHPAAAQLQR